MTRRHSHLPAAPLLAALHSNTAPSRGYSVAGILDAASRKPKVWDGRMVRVRGALQPGLLLLLDGSGQPTRSPAARVVGYVPLADGSAAMLWVTYRRENGLAGLLRRLPLLAALAPAPRASRVVEVRTYRVALHAVPAQCPSALCILGTLLDYTAPALDPFGFAGPSSSLPAKRRGSTRDPPPARSASLLPGSMLPGAQVAGHRGPSGQGSW